MLSPPNSSTSKPNRASASDFPTSAARSAGGNSRTAGINSRWLSSDWLVSFSMIRSNNTRSCATC